MASMVKSEAEAKELAKDTGADARTTIKAFERRQKFLAGEVTTLWSDNFKRERTYTNEAHDYAREL